MSQINGANTKEAQKLDKVLAKEEKADEKHFDKSIKNAQKTEKDLQKARKAEAKAVKVSLPFCDFKRGKSVQRYLEMLNERESRIGWMHLFGYRGSTTGERSAKAHP